MQQPNILPVLAVGTVGDLPYYTMPFVDGRSLRARLNEQGKLSIQETVAILRDVGRALAYAHKRGVVHRDVKPGNVLLSEGVAVVTDFGIAKAIADSYRGKGSPLERLTMTGSSVGTPAYMAPEQAVGDPGTDYRADTYAFGCVAYELLAGRPPFVARSAQQVVAAHLTDAPQAIAALRPDTPAPLARMVMECIEKDPAKRPATMAAVVERLDDTSIKPAAPRSPLRLVIAAAAIAALLILVRAVGFGSRNTLFAAGQIGRHDQILIGDFAARGADTALAAVVGAAFRAGLGQSQDVSIVPSSVVTDALKRMQAPPQTRLSESIAREIATRDGYKAIVVGELLAVDTTFKIAASLVGAKDGATLASFEEGAAGRANLLAAVERLAHRMRGKIGEPLRSVEASPALEKVTTSSLDALAKYTQADEAFQASGNFTKGEALLHEAIALDTGFAMAYRLLATQLNNQGDRRSEAAEMMQRAFDHRDRLPDTERYQTIADYYSNGLHQDADKAIAAYESILDREPSNASALNNGANLYKRQRDFAKAQDYYARALRSDSRSIIIYTNLVGVLMPQGKLDSARQVWRTVQRVLPSHPTTTQGIARFAMYTGQWDSAYAILTSALKTRSDLTARSVWLPTLASLSELQGRIHDAMRWRVEERAAARQRGVLSARLNAALDSVYYPATYGNSPFEVVAALDATLKKFPLDSIQPIDRPYDRVVDLYVTAGRVDRAKLYQSAFERSRADMTLIADTTTRHQIAGDIAMGEHRYADAVREYRLADWGQCVTCLLPRLAHALDLAGAPDSAIATYTRYLGLQSGGGLSVDARYLASSHRHLGDLFAARADQKRAAEHYQQFLTLWAHADPELQPQLRAVRDRLSHLPR